MCILYTPEWYALRRKWREDVYNRTGHWPY